MKMIIFGILTLVELIITIYFIVKIIKILIKKNESNYIEKALMQFFLMVGIIAGLMILEFSIAYIIPSDL